MLRSKSHWPASQADAVKPTANAANDKYIRCSNAASRMGTKLDVGARITKNQTPRNPQAGRFASVQNVSATRPTTMIPGMTIWPMGGLGANCNPDRVRPARRPVAGSERSRPIA